MKIGISTACFYPLQTELAFQKINDCNCKYTELFINSFSEFDKLFLETLKEIKNKNNTEILSIHPFTSMLETQFIFGDYPRRTEEGIELYKKIFDFTAKLGADICVFHGAVKQYNITAEQYVEKYNILHNLAKNNGIKLAQECVDRCKSSSPVFLEEIKKILPDINFVLDLKQTRRSYIDYEKFIDAMGENIVHLHLSDSINNNEKMDCMPIGEGDFDFYKLFKKLQKINYKGNAVVELYNHNFKDISQLTNSVKYLENVQKQL